MSNERQVLKISEVVEMLNNGKTRAEIGSHYQLNGTELKHLFSHESLKGKKTKKPFPYLIQDDTQGEVVEENTTEEVTADTEETVEEEITEEVGAFE